MRRYLLLALLAALLPMPTAAQTYPAKTIRIIVPWAPGGSTDVLARLIGIKMSENWGQPAVVENKPGASGNIGSDLVAKAPPDGYTLLVGSVSTHAMNPFLMASMPFKGVDDFTYWHSRLVDCYCGMPLRNEELEKVREMLRFFAFALQRAYELDGEPPIGEHEAAARLFSERRVPKLFASAMTGSTEH